MFNYIGTYLLVNLKNILRIETLINLYCSYTQEGNCVKAYLSTAAMRKVMAGTEFWMAEAKVGDVLSNPSK